MCVCMGVCTSLAVFSRAISALPCCSSLKLFSSTSSVLLQKSSSSSCSCSCSCSCSSTSSSSSSSSSSLSLDFPFSKSKTRQLKHHALLIPFISGPCATASTGGSQQHFGRRICTAGASGRSKAVSFERAKKIEFLSVSQSFLSV